MPMKQFIKKNKTEYKKEMQRDSARCTKAMGTLGSLCACWMP